MQFVRENEGLSITREPKFLLTVTQEMTEIDVEKFTWHVVKHKISWVPVTDAQNVGSDALSGTWVQESIVVFPTEDSEILHLKQVGMCKV